MSDAAAAIYGRSIEDLVSHGSLFDLLEEVEQTRLRTLIEARQTAGEPVPEHFETVVERPDGTLVPVELWVKATVEGDRVRTFALISDASEQRTRQRLLAHMATHDHLTGLPNRFLLADRIDTLLKGLERRSVPAVLSFIDLDRFKEVNDQHGHAVGDAVLKVVADRLVTTSRGCDTVARLGGDEFVVLCGDARGHGVATAHMSRLETVLAESIVGDGWSIDVGANVGSVSIEDASVGSEALLAEADLAMYEAKRRRRSLATPL